MINNNNKSEEMTQAEKNLAIANQKHDEFRERVRRLLKDTSEGIKVKSDQDRENDIIGWERSE